MVGTYGRVAGNRRTSRGYTLVALFIGITIMLVMIAAVLPLASTQARRDQEEELIFRGGQYVEGIRVFRRRQGRYPNSLKEMMEIQPRCLRRLWKDPIRRSEEWGLIFFGTPLGGLTPIGPKGGGPGPAPTPTPRPTPRPTPGWGAPPTQPMGPIIGVYSLSTDKTLRVLWGKTTYDEWKFTEQTMGMVSAQPGPGYGGDTGLGPPGGGGGGPIKK